MRKEGFATQRQVCIHGFHHRDTLIKPVAGVLPGSIPASSNSVAEENVFSTDKTLPGYTDRILYCRILGVIFVGWANMNRLSLGLHASTCKPYVTGAVVQRHLQFRVRILAAA